MAVLKHFISILATACYLVSMGSWMRFNETQHWYITESYLAIIKGSPIVAMIESTGPEVVVSCL